MSLPVLPSGFEWEIRQDQSIGHFPKYVFRAYVYKVTPATFWKNEKRDLYATGVSIPFELSQAAVAESYMLDAVRKAKMDFDRKQSDRRYVAEIDEQLKAKYGSVYKN